MYLLPQETEMSTVWLLRYTVSNGQETVKITGEAVDRYKTTTTAAFMENCGEPPKLQVKKAAF
jgi:hypothetical protein